MLSWARCSHLMDRPSSTSDDHEADQALRDARSRFVAGFTQRHGAMSTLLKSFSAGGDSTPLKSLREAAHKMAGLAGIVGFPTVSEHAAALETALLQDPIKVDTAAAALARMGAGFTHDLTGTAPSWAQDAAPDTAGARILLAEDDPEQRRVAAAGLRAAGFRVVTAESGPEAVETARSERPDLILLDIDLPGFDGMGVCRQLKLDPVLAAIPVVFCSARTGLMDRMAGLTLGADDYVTKPYAPSELMLRIRHLLSKKRAATAAPSSGLLPYDLFAPAATDLIALGPAAVVMIRVAPADVGRVSARLTDEMRRRDILGQFSASSLILVAPDTPAPALKASLRRVLDAVAPPLELASIGAAETTAEPQTLDALIAQADLALAQDRVSRSGDEGKTTILVAEDDADVVYVLDARLRAAGYRTVLAFDGEQTLKSLETETPAVVLLDLMMPKRTGFDVLLKLRQQPAPRPAAIVLSARGRDEDVTRAFELGAADYMTKPFNPDELMARIARLLK